MTARNLTTRLTLVAAACGFAVAAAGTSDPTGGAAAEVSDGTIAGRKTDRNVVGFSPYVDTDGRIRLPEDYKQTWAHLGSWAVARTAGSDIFEMHGVYTSPDTIAAYNTTGAFPDGAVLIKEVRESKSDQLTTGHAAWATDMKVWFVMIKDRKGRFDGNPHWGDGWGWALFEAKDPKKNVSAGYRASCITCHLPVEKSDWVYVYGYPDLKRPK